MSVNLKESVWIYTFSFTNGKKLYFLSEYAFTQKLFFPFVSDFIDCFGQTLTVQSVQYNFVDSECCDEFVLCPTNLFFPAVILNFIIWTYF